MTQQHTPGPWESVEFINDTGFFVNVAGDSAMHICSVEWTGQANAEEVAANARLIAAAPDMLDALRDIANMSIGQTPPSILFPALRDIARAAIAKATPTA